MTMPRFTVRTLMAAVLLVAANLAVGRALLASENPLLGGLVLPGVVLQVAVWRWVRAKGRARSFWAGFLVSGAVVTGSFVWGFCTPAVIGIGLSTDPNTGKIVTTRVEMPGSLMWRVWDGYAQFVGDRLLERWPRVSRLLKDDESHVTTLNLFALITFIPQWLIAVTFGGVAYWIAGKTASRPMSHVNADSYGASNAVLRVTS